MTEFTPKQTLDLRTTKCPLNFVKTKLALEKLALDDILEIWILEDSQSSLNIPKSVEQEGHTILKIHADGSGLQQIFIRRQ